MTYPIHEIFKTFQGEGAFMGLPALFIRTHGCPVKCDFCDSAGTWHPDHVPANIRRYSIAELAAIIEESGMRRVVLTGGEPAMFDWGPLIDESLLTVSFHMETSGAFPIKGLIDWVTVSPKKAQAPLPKTLRRANEYKFIIEQPSDIFLFTQMLDEANVLFEGANPKSIWLHPEWSQRENPDVLNAITRAVVGRERCYRAGWQIHKLYKADQLDPRSRPAVPLGGNPEKGY